MMPAFVNSGAIIRPSLGDVLRSQSMSGSLRKDAKVRVDAVTSLRCSDLASAVGAASVAAMASATRAPKWRSRGRGVDGRCSSGFESDGQRHRNITTGRVNPPLEFGSP